MSLDMIIRGGTIVDGSGLPRYRSDVGIANGRIVEIGRISGSATEVIDAEGQIVSPGFIDLHTHMDAQIFWDPLGTCSCWDGVTSVVMGNCGFTLAPSREGRRELVVRNLERAEDISADAMSKGLDWSFETYPEYLDALEKLPKGINYAGNVGHSALRTYVMGERAFEDEASDEDIEAMRHELRAGLRAGAVGFTTSRTRNHQTSDDRPVASRLASWDEVRALVGVLGEENTGVFELANEDVSGDAIPPYLERLRALAIESGRPITFGVGANLRNPDGWRTWIDELERTSQAGGRMFAMVHSRYFSLILSFESQLPFDSLPEWRELRTQPLHQQMAALRDPTTRARLAEIARNGPYPKAVGAEARKPDFDWMFVMDTPTGPHRTVGEIARENGADEIDTFLDLCLEKDLKRFFIQPFANENQDTVLELMRNPRTVVTFSDSGAHVSQIMDASIQTHMLAHWVREKEALSLEEAVRMLSFEPASAWGFHDRGLLREGMVADLLVFDPDRVGPRLPEVSNDLPGGSMRLLQKSEGISATLVNGQVVLRGTEPTGALPGTLLRSSAART